MTSEISKIHFWSQKIKFSFYLNKSFRNVLQVVEHIQECYFCFPKALTLHEVNPPSQTAQSWKSHTNNLRNFENPFLRSKNWIFFLAQYVILECVTTCKTHSKVIFLLFQCSCVKVKPPLQTAQRWKRLQNDLINENLSFWPQKWIFEISEVILKPFPHLCCL